MISFLWIFPPAIIAIVVGLTLLRPVLLHWMPSWASLTLFLLAGVPVTLKVWAMTDWDNPHLDNEIIVRIGRPLSVFLVPLVSFLVDWQSPDPKPRLTRNYWIRIVLELFLLFPLCIYLSGWAILLAGGYWI